jgi:hypothetical protein
MSKDKIITKWGPIIKNLGVVNTKLIEYISVYCEKYILENPDSDSIPKLNDMIFLFGVYFTRELDVEKFREERLNNIING